MRLFVVGLSVLAGVGVLAQQQVTLAPGDRVQVSCAGQIVNVSQTFDTLAADCQAVDSSGGGDGASLVIDHAAVTAEAFQAVPVAAVQALRIMSVDKSVGWNISQGLTRCLAVDSGSAASFCTRWAWNDGSYPVPPMTWTAHPLPGWQYFIWPGQQSPDGTPALPCADTSSETACFEDYLDAHASEWDVVSMQPTYLEAGTDKLTADDYLASYERIRAAHPDLVVILHTSNLSRITGTAEVTAFNDAVRAYVQTHGGVLIDVADIETFDPFGGPWFYNGFPVISPYYTSEVNGGHLGSPSAGLIREAQAWWIALGRIVGS